MGEMLGKSEPRTYVHATTEGVGQGHVLGGGGPDAGSVPSRANLDERGLRVRLADGGERGHAVEDVRVASRGGCAVDPLEKTEDEVAARDERLRVVVLVIGVHGDERRRLDAQAAEQLHRLADGLVGAQDPGEHGSGW